MVMYEKLTMKPCFNKRRKKKAPDAMSDAETGVLKWGQLEAKVFSELNKEH